MAQLTKTQKQWLDHIKAAHKSGQSYAEYCKQQNISANALYNVKKKLMQLGALTPDVDAPENESSKSVFVSAQVNTATKVMSPLNNPKIQIRFANGVELSIPENPSMIEKMLGFISIV